ncbi:hypothetical protein P167DRAFT_361239 [Morchella conica CCBAS932]|uniref:Uncharacterized protein n=1 Tax=Morchella conica CCBAS932 TaxID=1392247 RepID=A0A3N4KIS7_9PEZI|nr:hypothetical protein P167DRAFT_361239 [Morchella conica CCBAS932]
MLRTPILSRTPSPASHPLLLPSTSLRPSYNHNTHHPHHPHHPRHYPYTTPPVPDTTSAGLRPYTRDSAIRHCSYPNPGTTWLAG